MNGKIIIIQSIRLMEMRLGELTGRTGIITEDLSFSERKNKGYMVHLDKPFMDEYLWFIPDESIEYDK